ncbi:hypothetical protein GF325_09960 [Candidatus Bathyarchaeota archaeon]|nr:hypothetical protein [Candidatus Bathyarchaeota archaeon]
MNMVQVDHFAFHVHDMDASIAFYRDIVGLKLLSRDIDEDHAEEFAFMELDGGNLELLANRGEKGSTSGDTKGKESNGAHLAFSTNDIDAVVMDLREKGVDDIEGPFTITKKVKWLYFKDPDGNMLEYVQWMDE